MLVKKISNKTYFIISLCIGVCLCILFLLLGNRVLLSEEMRDFYLPTFKAIRLSGETFSQNADVPVLGSIGRDTLFSEAVLLNLLFMVYPATVAYVISFIIKISISVIGAFLIGKELFGEKSSDMLVITLFMGFFVAMLPVDAFFWFSIASIPAFFYFIIKIENKSGIVPYLCILIYPVFSEFFHIGIYLFVGVFVYALLIFVLRKRNPIGLIVADFLLLAGYLATEYRFVRLVCGGYSSLWRNLVRPWTESEGLREELFLLFLIALILVSYVLISKYKEKILIMKKQVSIGAMVAVFVVLLILPIKSNPFGGLVSLSKEDGIGYYYRESFYNKVKEDINYCGEWVCAYGIPTSHLMYNGFRVVDGKTAVSTLYTEEYDKDFEDVLINEEYALVDELPCVDAEKYKEFDGRLIFASKPIKEATSNGWILLKSYTGDEGDTLYIYQTESRYMAKLHSGIPFEERSSTSYSKEEFDELIDEMKKLSSEATKYKEEHSDMTDDKIVEKLDENRMISLYNNLQQINTTATTVYSIKKINYYKNIYDEENADELERMLPELLDMDDELKIALREAARSPFKVTLDELIGQAIVNELLEYEDMTDEEKELSVKIDSLGKEYEEASMEDYYFEYNGKVWSFEDFNNSYDELSREDFIAIYIGLYSEKEKVIGEIYKEIIQAENRLAELNGYDNYADMAYAESFARDFTTDDAARLFDYIKGCTKYTNSISESLYKVMEYDPGYLVTTDRGTYEMLYPYINDVDSELGVSLQYLLDNNLFDLMSSDTKPDIGFSTELKSFGDAYIFDSPYVQASDLFTFVHEFGHYNSFFYIEDKDFQEFNTIDVSEIKSQGLELIMASKYDQIFDENTAKFLECKDVSGIVDAVVNGAIIAEFEIYAFEHPEATTEELSNKLLKINNDYGRYYEDSVNGVYDWLDVSHLYSSPLYYISYVTSGLSALEIYELSYEDYDLATEKYMEISTLKSFWKYKEACEYVGLSNVFEKGTVKDIIRNVDGILRKKVG